MKLVAFLYLVISINGLRLFAIGGHAFEKSGLFTYIAAAVADRTPTPNECIEDWQTTRCPKAAILTSSHETAAKGKDVNENDDDTGYGYKHIFTLYGMAPQHVTVHADNYKIAANLSTE